MNQSDNPPVSMKVTFSPGAYAVIAYWASKLAIESGEVISRALNQFDDYQRETASGTVFYYQPRGGKIVPFEWVKEKK